MLAMLVMANLNHNTMPMDQLMRVLRYPYRARTFEPVLKTKTEFRGPAREQ
jgi:hypothetical protein